MNSRQGKRAPGQTTATYTVPKWMKKILQEHARNRLTNSSALVREALQEYLIKHGLK